MKPAYLLNPIFIIGLFVLLLNDHLLKDCYSNWLTGKASDVAGLLILPMFLKFLFPVSNRNAVLATALFFLFWKSPYAQPLIDTFNALDILTVGRVVDYTDLVAFLILPLAYYTISKINHFQFQLKHSHRWVQFFLLPLTLVAFVATSTEDEDYLLGEPTISSCCQSSPFEVAVGNGNVFIPTIFTPDNNGLNDYFQISADSNILRIDTFLIFSFGDYDTVFYQTNTIDFSPENGFDGVVNDTIIAAQYGYLLYLTSRDSVTRIFSGEICSIPCVDPLGVVRPVGIEGCAFSSQHNFTNGYDFSADSGEALDCFEN